MFTKTTKNERFELKRRITDVLYNEIQNKQVDAIDRWSVFIQDDFTRENSAIVTFKLELKGYERPFHKVTCMFVNSDMDHITKTCNQLFETINGL